MVHTLVNVVRSKSGIVAVHGIAHVIGGGNGTASTATAVPKFDKWGLSRTKVDSEQFQYQPVFI